MGHGQESGILDKILAVDFRDPPGDGARCWLGSLTDLFCFYTSFGVLEILLHGSQVLTALVNQIAFTGALDHGPIGKHLIPFLGIGFRLHVEQVRRCPVAYLHIPSSYAVTFLPSPKNFPRRTVARMATFGARVLICSVKQLWSTQSLLETSASRRCMCQDSTTGWNSRSGTRRRRKIS